MAVWQAVNVHVPDPLMPHHAGGVPAVDDAVVAVPGQKRSSTESVPGHWQAAEEQRQAQLLLRVHLLAHSWPAHSLCRPHGIKALEPSNTLRVQRKQMLSTE